MTSRRRWKKSFSRAASTTRTCEADTKTTPSSWRGWPPGSWRWPEERRRLDEHGWLALDAVQDLGERGRHEAGRPCHGLPGPCCFLPGQLRPECYTDGRIAARRRQKRPKHKDHLRRPPAA